MHGGCACRTIRYRLNSRPFDSSWCHCRNCQRISGAPAIVHAMLPRPHFAVEQGRDSLGHVRLTDFAERVFCRECGSPLATLLDHQPETIDIVVASLDDPGALPPEFHIFVESRVAWFDPGEAFTATPAAGTELRS